jgi:UDP-N-acetylmuramyl tripeptide synthase
LTGQPEARRITGPHLLDNRPGAAMDVAYGPGTGLAARWAAAARHLLEAVGWGDEVVRVREFAGGANLFASAPADALYAATDLVELAWAEATGAGSATADAIGSLRERIARERDPRLLALAGAAATRGLTFLHDDDGVSLGSGAGARLWALDRLPDPGTVDWSSIGEIPIALVTGSNGKTTTVRLTAAIAAAAGHRPGLTSTDGVFVGGETVVETDYAGPMGARLVLRHPRATLAVLETARGGILRRGVAVRRADAAAVTNISEDHFGDFGVASLDDLADAKLVIARVVPPDGAVVLNAGDPILRARGLALGRPVTWFAVDPAALDGLPAARTLTVRDGTLVAEDGPSRLEILPVAKVPAAYGGAATHNVANALAAAAIATSLPAPGGGRIGLDAVRTVLRGFTSEPGDNAGRGNLLEIDGVRVLIDYAHNRDALAAIGRIAGALPARRRLLMIGQAGDRTDDAIRGLARAAWALEPDLLLVKELGGYLRGRAEGEVPRLIVDELRRAGVPDSRFEVHESELAAVRRAIDWAEPGDLLVLLVHEDRQGVMELLGAQRLE